MKIISTCSQFFPTTAFTQTLSRSTFLFLIPSLFISFLQISACDSLWFLLTYSPPTFGVFVLFPPPSSNPLIFPSSFIFPTLSHSLTLSIYLVSLGISFFLIESIWISLFSTLSLLLSSPFLTRFLYLAFPDSCFCSLYASLFLPFWQCLSIFSCPFVYFSMCPFLFLSGCTLHLLLHLSPSPSVHFSPFLYVCQAPSSLADDLCVIFLCCLLSHLSLSFLFKMHSHK